MELVIKDVDGVSTLCEPEKSLEIIEKDWNLVQGFLEEQKELWEEYWRRKKHEDSTR